MGLRVSRLQPEGTAKVPLRLFPALCEERVHETHDGVRCGERVVEPDSGGRRRSSFGHCYRRGSYMFDMM